MTVDELRTMPVRDLVERYGLRLKYIGDHAGIKLGDRSLLQDRELFSAAMKRTDEIISYLRDSGEPALYEPVFVPSGEASEDRPELRQNVVRKWYPAQFYNANGCLVERSYLAESIDAARIQAISDAARENLALHDIREPAEILEFPGKTAQK